MVEIKDDVFIDKENTLEKMAEAHRKGLFTDITFTLSDNVEISTSKFLLACRSSYFATMFFDESLYVRRREKTALESKCDSKTMVKVLEFIWYGKVKFSDMDFHSLLKLLSVSMWMHLDSLNKGVSDFLQSLVIAKKVEFDDCLEAFNYVIYHNYKSLSGCLLTYMYQNLQEIMTNQGFRKLDEDSIVKIVKNGRSKLKIIDLFSIFTAWVGEENERIDTTLKAEMRSCFELEKFTRSEIQNLVRKTNLFTDKEILDVLEIKYAELEKSLASFREQESTISQESEETMTFKRKANQPNMERKRIKKEVESNPSEFSVKQELDDEDDDSNTEEVLEEYFENMKYEEDVKQELGDIGDDVAKINPTSNYEILLNCAQWKTLTKDKRNEIYLKFKNIVSFPKRDRDRVRFRATISNVLIFITDLQTYFPNQAVTFHVRVHFTKNVENEREEKQILDFLQFNSQQLYRHPKKAQEFPTNKYRLYPVTKTQFEYFVKKLS